MIVDHNSAPIDISIVIPVYNRGTLLRHTLASVRAASAGLKTEIVAVDDGSIPPLADDLARTGHTVDKLIRQPNQGLLFARLTGLAAASGRYVLFLDSDDLISADKLRAHVATMDATHADVSYSDTARQTLDDVTGPIGPVALDGTLGTAQNAAEFFITIQPAPHSPVFATDYLRACVATAFFPPSSLYNPVAEIWFYHICAPFPARVFKTPSGLAIIGQHPGARLTNHWEKLAVASLAVMEAFARSCPMTAETLQARQLVAEKAFVSWRRLPRGFSPEFCSRQLSIWRRLKQTDRTKELGGKVFQTLAGLIGLFQAGYLLKLVQNGRYKSVQTLDSAMFIRLLTQLPPS